LRTALVSKHNCYRFQYQVVIDTTEVFQSVLDSWRCFRAGFLNPDKSTHSG